MDTLLLLGTFALGGLMAFIILWARQVSLTGKLRQSEYLTQQLNTEIARLQQEKQRFEQTFLQSQAQILQLSEEKARLEGELYSLSKHLEERESHLRELQGKLETLQKNHENSLQTLSQLQAHLQAAQENLSWRESQTKQLETLFENLMQKIIQEGTSIFQTRSQDSIASLLQPFREQLENLQKEVKEYGMIQQKNVGILHGFIEKILQDSQKLSQQTEALTRALRGDIRVQGRWGEARLKELLDLAGFKEGAHYSMQVPLQGESGLQFRPDVVFNLPDGRHVLIDAKVSLTSYESYFAATSEDEQKKHLQELANSLRKHIRELSKYQKANIPHIGWTILFCPVEGALQMSLQVAPDLLKEAQEARVILAGPFILTGFIHLTGQLWQYEKRNRYAEEIARLAQKMLDKLARFVEELDKVGRSLDKAKESYEAAYKYLTSGKENVIATAKRIEEHGISLPKPIPSAWVDDALSAENQVDRLSLAHPVQEKKNP
ncbi:MAG: DNA recombination protein RmuC [Bacteroidia bacterium]|nr:DNA recombination protein RmuC [Bacteroidia bacterium]MDW8133826.1 DNA recombination protein RmuC [Bacteroidia bacterium]